MSSSYFTCGSNADFINLKKSDRIHFVGVSGVAMGQLAASLCKDGYQVSGSDQSFYEPMGSFLSNAGIQLYKEYSAENITADIKLAVIGNAVKSTHPEVQAVAEKQIPFISFAELLYQYLIKSHKSLVISGTHGKTTTTAIAAQVLNNLDESPNFFFGGVLPGFSSSLVKGQGKISVVEGDEYDTAFFAKVPKFSFYAPDVWVINALEFDHADIYQSLENIIAEFEKGFAKLSSQQTVVLCTDFPAISERLTEWKKRYQSKFISFGIEPADFQIISRKTNPTGQLIKIKSAALEFEIKTSLYGAINARNTLAAYLGLWHCGIAEAKLQQAFKNLTAVKRRLEVFGQKNSNIFMEDFAHHPTAVSETLKTLREIYPGKKIITIFEPASNTSRRDIFQKEFAESFSLSDSLILLNPKAKGSETLLNPTALLEQCQAADHKLLAFNSDEIISHLKRIAPQNTVIILMSNGAFDGLKTKLTLSDYNL